MKKNIVFLVIALVASAHAVFAEMDTSNKSAQPESITSMQDPASFMTFYYQKKNVVLVVPALEYLINLNDFMKEDNTHLKPSQHFFAAIGHEDPAVLEQIKGLKGKYSGLPAKIISEIIQESESFISPEPRSLKDLDYLWSEFMATGDDVSVRKIIDLLKLDPKHNMEMIGMISAAQWSLLSNGVQHEKVHEIIKSEAISSDGSVKERLNAILHEIEAEKSSKNISQQSDSNKGTHGFIKYKLLDVKKNIVLDEGQKEISEIHREDKKLGGELNEVYLGKYYFNLYDDFIVGYSLYGYKAKEIFGFGLWLEKSNTKTFSWEWYERIDEHTFKKLQGPGTIRVDYKKRDGYWYISKLTFMDTQVLRSQLDTNTSPVVEDWFCVVLAGSNVEWT